MIFINKHYPVLLLWLCKVTLLLVKRDAGGCMRERGKHSGGGGKWLLGIVYSRALLWHATPPLVQAAVLRQIALLLLLLFACRHTLCTAFSMHKHNTNASNIHTGADFQWNEITSATRAAVNWNTASIQNDIPPFCRYFECIMIANVV